MNKVLLFFLLAIGQNAFTQDTLPQLSPGVVGYEQIVMVDSASEAPAIFTKALAWFNSYFRSGKSVIDMQDKESATIIAKPMFNCRLYTRMPNDGFVTYNFSVWAKKGKYRYRIENLVWHDYGNLGTYKAEHFLPTTSFAKMNKRLARKTIEEINLNINEALNKFSVYMAKSDNW